MSKYNDPTKTLSDICRGWQRFSPMASNALIDDTMVPAIVSSRIAMGALWGNLGCPLGEPGWDQ